MKKVFYSVSIFILSSISKASDIGLNVSSLKGFTKQNDVVAMEGTGTCRTAGPGKAAFIPDYKYPTALTLGEIKEKLKRAPSLEKQQEILDFVEKVLLDDSYKKN